MTIANILEHLQSIVPLALAQEWDNVGLLIGEPQRQVNGILISLDASANAVDYALQHGYDLILSHHPLIFRPLQSITNPVILKMIETRIALISMHTNFDAAWGGVNHALAEALDLEVLQSLGDEAAGDIGLLCKYDTPQSLSGIALDVKAKLQVPAVKLWTAAQSMQKRITRIAICGGAGASVLPQAQAQAELLITGDISYHSFLDSAIPILDAGHFYTEYPALKNLQTMLQYTGIKNEILPRTWHEWTQAMHYL